MDLNTIWFVLLGLLITGYAILDGFDLGVGIMLPFVKEDDHRRIFLNSIGPVWDGNEVWLVVSGGVLFAAFPEVYASVLSGLYEVFILLLLALIFRGVSIEFRSKRDAPLWRMFWDYAFFTGSLLVTLLLGIALGNIARGLPLSADLSIRLPFQDLLQPYALLVALTTTVMFAMHGSIYLAMKTEGDLQRQVNRWIMPLIVSFFICATITVIATLNFQAHLVERYIAQLGWLVVPAAALLVVLNIPHRIHKGLNTLAFISSCLAIALLIGMLAIGLFPYLVYSSLDPAYSLTIYNSASSPQTLQVILVIALIGMPLVLAYTGTIYWIFRGKVKLGPRSY